jgi:hypothetical protein
MLVTNSGQEFKGSVLNIDYDTVTFSVDNEEKVFEKEQLLRIEFTKDSILESTITLSNLNDPVLNAAISSKVLPENYPNAGYIKLYREKEFTYTNQGEFISSYRNIIQVLQERGKSAGVISLAYKKDIQSAQIDHGRTISSNVVYNYDSSSMRESSMYYRYPDYDKMKIIRFPLSNIVIGSVLDSKYSVTQHKIDKLEPVYKETYFSSYEPVLKQRLIIKFPKDSKIDISLRYMGEEGIDYTFEKKEEDEYIVYIYEKKNIKAIVKESYMPSDDMIMPRITLSISPGFDEIAERYTRELNKKLVFSNKIKDKVSELTRDLDNKIEKIFNIYNYIVKEINLIYISPINYSYLPKESDYIFKKKAGSYIDKAFLFYTFLKAADINCKFVLVKERDEGELINENPCIKQFNYPLVKIPLDISTLYVSTLNKDLKITDIDESIQGGYGLIVSEEGGKIIKIPLKFPERENISSSFIVELFKDGDIKVKEKKSTTGNNQSSLRMFQYIPDKELKQHMLQRVQSIHPNAELIDYKFENLSNLRNNPKMEINYSIKDYMISAGGELLAFQLPSFSYSAYGVGKKERNYPLSFGNPVSTEKKYILKLPDNYKIYHLPKNYSYKSDNFIYTASYKTEENNIIFSDSYQRTETFMPKEAYFELKKCLNTKAELAKEWIVIKRK